MTDYLQIGKQIGKLYKVPWKVASYEASHYPDYDHMLFDYAKRFDIPDGSYVVLLEVKVNKAEYFYNNRKANTYILKVLTEDGVVAYVECTEAGLDYWNIVGKA